MSHVGSNGDADVDNFATGLFEIDEEHADADFTILRILFRIHRHFFQAEKLVSRGQCSVWARPPHHRLAAGASRASGPRNAAHTIYAS